MSAAFQIPTDVVSAPAREIEQKRALGAQAVVMERQKKGAVDNKLQRKLETVCKKRPKPKNGGGKGKAFVPWCK